MKKLFVKIFVIFVFTVIFGIAGLFKFAAIGGNNCDMDGKFCDCFCCNMFNTRGYEACGDFGLLGGTIFGSLFGYAAYKITDKFSKRHEKTIDSVKK
jgi:hypothetical protein